MRIVLLGTGSPILETERQGPATLVQIGDDHLLFDAGRGVNTQLLRLGLSPSNLRAIFITHHHADHINDLGAVIIAAWHAGREERLHVLGPQGTGKIVSALLNTVYARDIAFNLAMDRLEGRDKIDIRDVVEVIEIEPGLVYAGEGWQVFAEYVEHGHSLVLTHHEWPCLGYRVEGEGKAVAISGDTIPCAGLDKLAQGTDALVQCCYLAEEEITTPAFRQLSDAVIASSGQVGKIASRAGVGKLLLTHFRKKPPEMMRSLAEDVRHDYGGELYIGEDVMIVEV